MYLCAAFKGRHADKTANKKISKKIAAKFGEKIQTSLPLQPAPKGVKNKK